MSDQQTGAAAHAKVDPERDAAGKPFDNLDGHSGQEYSREREAAEGKRRPSGHPLIGDPSGGGNTSSGGSDIPPNAGRRASFEGDTGEVRGSGASGEGEEFDVGTPGGG